MRPIDKLVPERFLNITTYDHIFTDYVVVGSGIAGLSAANELAKNSKVMLITKSKLIETNTNYAQGGIAVVLSNEDEFELHIEDTLYAGAGLCDVVPVEILVKEGPIRIKELIEMNTNFDKKEDGNLSMTKEAAHSRSRILHAGDTTGAEIERALTAKIENSENIEIKEYMFLIDIFPNNKCLVYNILEKRYTMIYYKGLILGTGSIGQIYEYTSNPDVATGDGIALAYRIGAELADLEFVQFHPTTFYKEDAPRFLISESLRGEGGVLRNKHGERFMERYHEKKELAPRDVVSRSILSEMMSTNEESVYLDMTGLDEKYLFSRFPSISKFCMDYGIDISKNYIPVSPAAHYAMGGIYVDTFCRTGISGLYAAGEVAMSGVHGANRLASNSLLEGLVFGKIAGEEAYKTEKDRVIISDDKKFNHTSKKTINREGIFELRNNLRSIMWNYVGIVRDGEGLTYALKSIEDIVNKVEKIEFNEEDLVAGLELINMITVAYLITEMALNREESRGAHYRTDFSETREEYRKHSRLSK